MRLGTGLHRLGEENTSDVMAGSSGLERNSGLVGVAQCVGPSGEPAAGPGQGYRPAGGEQRWLFGGDGAKCGLADSNGRRGSRVEGCIWHELTRT